MWVALIALALLGEMVGCSDGGGGGGGPTAPLLPWARLRQAQANIGVSSATINGNDGTSTLVYESNGEIPSGGVPIIGRSGSIYVSTETGLLSLDQDGNTRWFLEFCDSEKTQPLTHLASPSISRDGREILVASADPDDPNGGKIFLLREPESGDDDPSCEVAFRVGSTSAALSSVDGGDLRLLSFVTGTVSGRLVSISNTGQRRWSYPAGEPFAGDVSSSPAISDGGFVIVSPEGELHSVDASGRKRWSATIGGGYPEDEIIPSPATFREIFTVSAEGDVVAFSSDGERLWTFTPDAPVVGSIAVSGLAVQGGALLGENVIFALDQTGTVYGIGSESGELVRFCETENRACQPSTCEDEAPCNKEKRCSETSDMDCTSADDCPDGESCMDQFFCSNAHDLRCVRDLCVADDEDDSDGVCQREARQSLASSAVKHCSETSDLSCGSDHECPEGESCVLSTVGSIAVSADAMVVASTSDGRVCARGLDGSVPAGTCQDDGDELGDGGVCTPDSCPSPDSCCDTGDDECSPCAKTEEPECTSCTEDDADCPSIPKRCKADREIECTENDDCPYSGQCRLDPSITCTETKNRACPSTLGHCKSDPSIACTTDTCGDDGICETLWDDGCISLGSTPLTAPVIDNRGSIFVTTSQGIARIE